MRKVFSLFPAIFSLYVWSQNSQNVNFLYNWHDPSIVVSPDDFRRYNEVWGYEQDGIEYAILGSLEGMHFIQIPASGGSLQQVDFVQGRAAGNFIIHRDFKNYRNYLYAVCDEGNSSLQIIDMQYLPDSVHVVYDNDSLIVKAHNLFIDTLNARLYVFGATTQIHAPYNSPHHAMIIFSIEDPENPQFLGEFIHPIYTYVHDGYVRNDTAYLNCGYSGFYIGNFSNPTNPIPIADYTSFVEQGYNHSGWLSADGKYYTMADETHGKQLKLMDVSDLQNIDFCSIYGLGANDTDAIPHNPIIRDNYIYISYYHYGLQVYEYKENCSVERIAFYDTYPDEDYPPLDYAGAWGVYPNLPSRRILLSDMQSGLYVFEPLFYVGQEEISDELNVQIFPNPAYEMIRIDGLTEGTPYRIIDISGRTVLQGNYYNPINIRDLPEGIYLIQVMNKETEQVLRLIKAKWN